MPPEDDPADDISAEDYYRGMAEADSEHKTCVRCGAGMPTWRVNPVCEECYAEESEEYDEEAEMD
jgi:predicted amidophosphoribosyltransferase